MWSLKEEGKSHFGPRNDLASAQIYLGRDTHKRGGDGELPEGGSECCSRPNALLLLAGD